MANMSYCRFENTVQDLRDCYENMGEVDEGNLHEVRAREQLVTLCFLIVTEYKEEILGD